MAIPPRTSAIRDRRLDVGLTQAELASRAGVSRQLVAAVEAGQNTPAVDAALGLARVLGASVEELFAHAPADVVPALGGRLPDGTLVRVGRVSGRLVVSELADHGAAGAGWARADGFLQDGRLRLFPGAAPAGLVLAGCDPALGVAEAMLQGLGSRSLLAIPAPTGSALRAIRRGTVHAAVVHGRPGKLPPPPESVVRVHFARWQVGLGLAPALRGRSLEDLLGSRIVIAQRQAAAASQQAFKRAAATAGLSPPSSGLRAATHIDAARLAATVDGAAVTTEGAAAAFDLSFMAFEEHTVEIWFSGRWRDHPGIHALTDLLNGSALTQRIERFGGYDLTGCGSVLSDPPA